MILRKTQAYKRSFSVLFNISIEMNTYDVNVCTNVGHKNFMKLELYVVVGMLVKMWKNDVIKRVILQQKERRRRL